VTEKKSFLTLTPGRGRFSSVDPLEELVQHPDDGRVVFRAKHFGHEGSVLKNKEMSGQAPLE
jgi:hypothetical protein